MSNKNKSGYTIMELAIVIIVLGMFALIGWAVPTANIWFTKEGVLHEIQLEHPEAVWVLKSERYIFTPSNITVQNMDGSKTTYLLNSNILFNYNIE